MFKVPEKYREKEGLMASSEADGNNGVFIIKTMKLPLIMTCIASDEMGWEHVSVSTHKRCPTWEEMCFIKDLFWGEEDLVMQLHPPKSEYVNNHPYCLHLWRKAGTNDYCEKPPSIMVGYREVASG